MGCSASKPSKPAQRSRPPASNPSANKQVSMPSQTSQKAPATVKPEAATVHVASFAPKPAEEPPCIILQADPQVAPTTEPQSVTQQDDSLVVSSAPVEDPEACSNTESTSAETPIAETTKMDFAIDVRQKLSSSELQVEKQKIPEQPEKVEEQPTEEQHSSPSQNETEMCSYIAPPVSYENAVEYTPAATPHSVGSRRSSHASEVAPVVEDNVKAYDLGQATAQDSETAAKGCFPSLMGSIADARIPFNSISGKWPFHYCNACQPATQSDVVYEEITASAQ